MKQRSRPAQSDVIPDVRDGLTRVQRVVLYVLWKTSKELGRSFVPTAMLYGRVVEHVNLSEAEFQAVLRSLGVADGGGRVQPPRTPAPPDLLGPSGARGTEGREPFEAEEGPRVWFRDTDTDEEY